SITNIKSSAVPLNEDWRPLTFSENGTVEGPLVFAGYGMKAPKTDDLAEYDSYVHLPVEGKWVMVFRYMPEDVPVSWRTQRALQSQLRVKAATIRDLGGLGMIIVSGPKSNTKQEVIPLSRDSALGKISIPVISIADDIAEQLMKSAGQDLGWWQNQLDNGDLKIGFEFPDVRITANVDVEQIRGRGRNVIGRLQFEQQPTDQCVVVGAHIDHLGTGVAGSMARNDEKGQIHRGADDNASGVAAMLEIAQFMSAQKRSGKITAGRDLVIAGWSGEELGLHGSNHFVDAWMKSYGKDVPVDGGSSRPSLQDRVVAYLNMDMVGRFDGKLVLQGLGSS
ncbi:MAG: M28 family peptidase, partial [Planctomycetaceae bacterium]|nr:M28 family peptidase [Planctomycetaceae bacterium]